jgi:ribosomal protein L11 methylase PrmA
MSGMAFVMVPLVVPKAVSVEDGCLGRSILRLIVKKEEAGAVVTTDIDNLAIRHRLYIKNR